jgi:hypothetical protein
MDKVCPVCNGLQPIMVQCPQCGETMEDGGPVQDYGDPYAPYMDFGVETYCVHLLYCPACHYDFRVAVELVCV